MGTYYDLPTRIIDNDHLRVEFLAEAGPRIVRLFLNGWAENLLAEAPDAQSESPHGTYHFRGGHRLWVAPERFATTYIPDDEGVTVEPLEGEEGARICGPVEAPTGLRKCIDVIMHPGRPALTLRHEIRNAGVWPVELAPWAITQLPLGGMMVLPQPSGPVDADGLLPNRHLNLWSYTRWQDPRLLLEDDVVLVQGSALLPPCKIGYLNFAGWAGYLNRGVFFCKRFAPQPGVAHPDGNSNVEVYCNHRFIELETLAPLAPLAPGASVSHTESWEFYSGIDVPQTIDGARELVAAVIGTSI